MTDYRFHADGTVSRILLIPREFDTPIEDHSPEPGEGPEYTTSLPDDFALSAVITLDQNNAPIRRAFERASILPDWRVPDDYDYNITPPMRPTGGTITPQLGVDLSITPQMSNRLIDLRGGAVGRVTIVDGARQFALVNGQAASIVNTPRTLTPFRPLDNFDVTLANLIFQGGTSINEGNGLRVGRLHIANCASIAATQFGVRGGIHSTVLWGDPGGTDIVVQDCDFRTLGVEACIRLMNTNLWVVQDCRLETAVTPNPPINPATGRAWPANKHCMRAHTMDLQRVGDTWVVPSRGGMISGCTLINHGMMFGTLPDNTPQAGYDIVRGIEVVRNNVHMSPYSPVAAASFQFPGSAPTPAGTRPGSGMIRLQNARVEDNSFFGTFDQVDGFRRVAGAHPELNWLFANNRYVQVTR
jgi:hypothetical protein